jgi:hypothetical protein
MLKIAEKFMKPVKTNRVQEVMLFFKSNFIGKMVKTKGRINKIYFSTKNNKIFKIRGSKL